MRILPLSILVMMLFGFSTKPPVPNPVPSPTTIPDDGQFSGPMPLKGWDAAYSTYLIAHISQDLISLSLKGICPHEPSNKLQALTKVFQAMAYAESSFNRTQRYVETGIPGKDLVSGEPNTSEGLLQVSQQDAKLWKCPFSWAHDKHLSKTDPNKSIFNPYKNLQCGLDIFTGLKKRTGGGNFQAIGRAYWSTLRPTNVSGFRNFTQELTRLGGCL